MVVRNPISQRTFADVLRDLGGISPDRIRAHPAPGTATEEDLLRSHKPTCELIDGILVEKAMGNRESMLGSLIGRFISECIEADDLGVVLGEAGHFRLGENHLRAPDASFIPWSAFPGGEIPDEAYWSVAPALIVEVLSRTNTTAEIDRKLREFFAAGTALAWVIDPRSRTASVYTSPKRVKELDSAGVLDGGKVLPGFKLPLADLFAAGRPRKKKPR